jgi:hypothetical protein
MNPVFRGGLNYHTSDGQSFYNSLRLNLNKRLSSGTSVQFNYTFAKSVDDGAGGGDSSNAFGKWQYPYLRTLDRALSDFDIRHQLTMNYFYPVPFGRGRQWLSSGVLSHLLGAWRVGGIVRFRTGTPISAGMNVRRTGYLFETTRPNLRPGYGSPAVRGATAGCGPIAAGEELGTSERYFDPCAYEFPAPGTLGNAGRNTIVGPQLFTTDVSLQREFSLGSDRLLQFRMELFNLTNHTNLGPPANSATSVFIGSAGRYNASGGRVIRTATTARQLQFGLRLSF